MVVYWSVPHLPNKNFYRTPYYLNVKEPQPLSNELAHLTNVIAKNDSFFKCPCYHEFLKNKFVIKSPFSYNLTWTNVKGNKSVSSDLYDQEFFDKHVTVRDVNIGLVNLLIDNHIFFSEEDCEMEVTPPYLSYSDFSSKTIYVPGSYNISQWFRRLDLTFLIKEPNQKITINQDDAIMGLNFKTNQKITFKKFYFSDRMSEIYNYCLNQKAYNQDKNIKTYLNKVYNLFKQSKLKNVLLKEIKSNLME